MLSEVIGRFSTTKIPIMVKYDGKEQSFKMWGKTSGVIVLYEDDTKEKVEDGRILHRDISENNIIIINAVAEGDPKGMLIDLELLPSKVGNPRG